MAHLQPERRLAAELLHVPRSGWTSGKVRRALQRFSAEVQRRPQHWRYTHGRPELSRLLRELDARDFMKSRVFGIAFLNEVGKAAVVLPPTALPTDLHSAAARALFISRHSLTFPEDFPGVEFIAGRNMDTTNEGEYENNSRLINAALRVALPRIEAGLTEHQPHEVVSIVDWMVQDHRRMQVVLGEKLCLPLTTLQLLNECVRHLRQPAVHTQLSLTDCTKVIFALANVRLTPPNLIDSLAVHTTETLLPALREELRHRPQDLSAPTAHKAEEDLATPQLRNQVIDEDDKEALTVVDDQEVERLPLKFSIAQKRTELTLLSKAVAGFARAAELGRIPLRDVLAEMAAYVATHDAPLIDMASPVHLMRLSYLSAAVSKKWGDDGVFTRTEVVHDVLAQVGRASLRPDNVEFYEGTRDYQWRLLVNLCQGGVFSSIEDWITVLMNDPNTDPRLLSTLTFSVVRYLEGLGYRDPLATNTVETGDDGADDAEGAELDGPGVILNAMPEIRDQYLLPRADELTYREASHVIYAYGRRKMLTGPLVHAMGSKLVTAVQDGAHVPPYLVSNFFHAIAVAWPRSEPKSESHAFFAAIEPAITSGRLDLAPEKPNHTVYLIFAATKLEYKSETWVTTLCALLTDEAVERLKLPSVAMAVMSLASIRPVPPTVTTTTQNLVTIAARKLTTCGTNRPLGVDLIALGLSTGAWQKDGMITPLFELSKAFVQSGSAEKGLGKLSGKSLARLLWSHAVVSVRHTTLCALIAQRLEDPDFVTAKFDDPLSLTSALVAFGRLGLKNHRALGALCAHAASKAHEMKAISLADTVQAVAEMGLPNRSLKLFLLAAAVQRTATFTPQQAASFVWNTARTGLVPAALTRDADQHHLAETCYTRMFDVVMPKLDTLDVKFLCRVVHTLGLLGRSSPLARHLPAALEAAMRHIDDVWWRDLANVLWTLAVLQHVPSDEHVAALQRWRHRQNFLPEDLARVRLWDEFIAQRIAPVVAVDAR
eukprot:TRINITY_DN12228_c0_g1_i2.p1 TRINITY_DN12228_c0_g1~~TRINITY_DN12228_c0_g1_i2.p1  ORF type:complete len:999 (+),score=262.85 TRINITY_DN12228_c0_g1_i2:108-3104(+)